MTEVPENPFPARLREAREATGLTQELLGTKAGIPAEVARTRVNRYEKGVREPDEATARQLADALGVPLAALYADTPTMAALIEAVSRLSEGEQQELIEQLGGRAGSEPAS